MIYLYCNKDVLTFFIDYINSLLFNYNDKLLLTTDINELNGENPIIFIQNIPCEFNMINIKKSKIFILNTEQIYRDIIKDFINNLDKDINIIDYSLSNISLVENKSILYLPYLINRNEILNYEKPNDIAVIGDWESEYRRIIKQNIELKTKINLVEGFDKERDEFLFRHKILLNIHYDKNYKIFEQFRCNRCILNNITEKSQDVDFELKDFIIECDYTDIVTTTIYILENYEYFYNKLFSNFDIELINYKYKLISDKFFEELSKRID